MKPVRLGHYLLLEQLHLGAFAEVYLGRTRSLPGMEQLVAIKRIHPLVSADEDFLEAFLDEARIAAQLRHGNIAQVLEVGEEEGTYFIAMEYVSGRPLRALLELSTRQGESLPSDQAAWLVSRICEGLEHAHRKLDVEGAPLGIVHRAISPENVLVGFDGEVKIIDFGLAKAANSTQRTEAGTMKGKLGYLSPEQVLGRPVDRRTDIFSVGVLLFEMLTGMRLFGAPNEAETIRMVGDAQVPPPRSLNPAIPEALERVVLKALAREPDDRHQWASELASALSPFITSERGAFSAAGLADVMHRQFSDALAEESERLRRLAKVRELPLPGPAAAGPTQAASRPSGSIAAPLPPSVAPMVTPLGVSAVKAEAAHDARPAHPLAAAPAASPSAVSTSAPPPSLPALPSPTDAAAGAPPDSAPAPSGPSPSPSTASLAASLFGEDAPADDPDLSPSSESQPDAAVLGTRELPTASHPVPVEAESFDLSAGLPRAFADEDEDDDPEDRTQVISPAVMEATLESGSSPPPGRAPPSEARPVAAPPHADWQTSTQPFVAARGPEVTAGSPAGARSTTPQPRLPNPAPPVEQPASRSAAAPLRRPGQPIETTARPTGTRPGPSSPRPPPPGTPGMAPARPASGVHPVLAPAARPSTANRPAVGAPARTADREPASSPAEPRFPDRSHPAFEAAARASEPGRQGRATSGGRASLTSPEVVILASNDQPPGAPGPASGSRLPPATRQSPIPPGAAERTAASAARATTGVQLPPAAGRSRSANETGRVANAARAEFLREELEPADVTDPGLALPRVTLAVAPSRSEQRSPALEAGRSPLARLWPLAAAAAVLLCLGLWALLRSPDGSTVVVRVTPAQGTIVTLGGRQVQNGRAETFPPGEYELVAMAEGYLRHSQRITVFEDAPEAVYPVILEEEAPARPTAASPRETPAIAAAATPPAKEFTARFASAVEGVEIFVEGKSIGRTPEARATLSVGRAYSYEARAEGYRSAEGTFGSYGDPEVTVELALERLPEARKPRQTKPARGVGHLVCTSTPQGAEIFIDGKPTGRRTPVPATDPIELPEGRHRVLFEIAGVVSEVKTITVEAGKTVSLQGVPVDRDREL